MIKKESRRKNAAIIINNDIYRIVAELNKDEQLKKFLYNKVQRPLSDEKTIGDLIDINILRAPIIDESTDKGSYCVVSLVKLDRDESAHAFYFTIAVDVFTPGNQWIIDRGVRPLLITERISDIIENKLSQTGGVNYRHETTVSAQLTNNLTGYRMLFNTVIDD